MGHDPRAVAEAAARRMPGWADLAMILEPVEAGLTNRNFRLVLPDASEWMVRLPGERTEVLGIDRACEAEAAARADVLGIGPPVRGELPGVGTLVTRWVAGHHVAAGPGFAAELDRVVPLVRRFHDSGPLGHRFPIFRVVEWHGRDAVAHGVALPPEYERLLAGARRIERAFAAAPEPEVPSHNDLWPPNILFGDGRTWLLDWEYAGMNDRWFDLASLAGNSGLDTEGERRVVELYAGAVTPGRWARLQLMKIMSQFREGMWAVVQQGISTLTHVDFVGYAAEHLDICSRLLDDPRVPDWLETVGSDR